jgi:hypothetical protein
MAKSLPMLTLFQSTEVECNDLKNIVDGGIYKIISVSYDQTLSVGAPNIVCKDDIKDKHTTQRV